MKYIKRIILVLTVIIILRLGLPFLDLYPYKLMDSYYFIGTGNKSYIIKKGFFGKTLVSDMDRQCEWIITSSAIYGHKGDISNLEDDYFYINKATDSVLYFQNLTELNDYLSSQGFNRYSMSDSENISHLKTGNRKFK